MSEQRECSRCHARDTYDGSFDPYDEVVCAKCVKAMTPEEFQTYKESLGL